jgi:hypothetical protein
VPFSRYGLAGEQELAWCARFVRWCIEKAGGKVPGNRFAIAAVKAFEDAFKAKGWHHAAPAEGDVVFFAHRMKSDAGYGRHCGIVVEVGPGHIRTVEGNRGDAVGRGRYEIGDASITGYGRLEDENG